MDKLKNFQGNPFGVDDRLYLRESDFTVPENLFKIVLWNDKMMNIGGKQRFKLELEKFISTRLRPVSGIFSVERGADQKKGME